jgi:uncharacterized protein
VLELIRASAYREQPWKNGGGLTHEIAASDFWRLSIATIDRDGPFSEYRGFDRTIVAIDGAAVELEVKGAAVLLAPFEPFEFAGEDAVYARVRGRARDLNVMTARDDFVHDVTIVRERERFVLDEEETAFVVAIDGDVTVEHEEVSAGDTLALAEIEGFTVTAHGRAAVVRLTEL